MNGRSLAMLMMAVLCGLGAMYGTTKLISKDTIKPVEEMQDVLVATRDLKIEEMVKPDLVKVARMVKTNVPAGAFSSPKDLEDRWVQIGMLEGEPVVDKKLAPRGSPAGLVGRIPKGMRAYAIDVTEQSGVSGFILPDHRVDVVRIEGNQNGQPEADTVLQNVLVLASGQVFTRPEDKSIQSHTVTLAVTPGQVDILVAAKQRGTLSLSLRGINDHDVAESRKPKVKEPETPKVVEPPPPVVEEPVVVKPPEPAPPPVATPPPARYLSVYRGIDNMRRIRLDHADDVDGDVPAVAQPAPSTVPTLPATPPAVQVPAAKPPAAAEPATTPAPSTTPAPDPAQGPTTGI